MKNFLYWFVFLFLCIKPVFASDLFSIPSISVLAEDKTAVIAREIALKEGQEKAFGQLIHKIVPMENQGDIPDLTTEDILNFVQDVSIQSEKTTSTKYMADISVRFNAESIRSFLRAHHVPFLTQIPPKLVLLWIFKNEYGALFLFEKENPIYQYLARKDVKDDLFDFVIPDENKVENQTITAERMINSHLEMIQPLLKEYKTKGAMIVYTYPYMNGYQTQARIYPDMKEPFAISFATDMSENVFSDIWAQFTALSTQKWQELKIDRSEKFVTYQIIVPVLSLEAWVNIQKKLVSHTAFKEMIIKTLKNNQIILEIPFKESEEELLYILRQQGFQVFKSADSIWIVDIDAVKPNNIQLKDK